MQLTVSQPSQMIDIENINRLQKSTKALLSTGHYKRLGEAGIFAVLQMSQSLNIDPFVALNGALYPVDGKIEMDSQMMMALIRQKGHSVTKDKKSTATHCILHGKRADTGDTWTESFSMEDAKKAGLLSRGVYSKYGRDMFQWRALSRLAKFLFPDVIKGCYAIGEIRDAPKLDEPVDAALEEQYAEIIEAEIEQSEPKKPTADQIKELGEILAKVPNFKEQVFAHLEEKYSMKSLSEIDMDIYLKIKDRVDHLKEAV